MKIEVDRLTEAELIDLDNRIVGRLRFFPQMQSHVRMLECRIGHRLEFPPEGHPRTRGRMLNTSICRVAALLLLSAMTVTTSRMSAAAESNWTNYTLSEYGFAVDLPSRPEFASLPSPTGDGWLVTYRAVDPVRKHQFSVFVGQPEQRGIFEPASMDAYLDGHLKSMVQVTNSGQIKSSRRTTFLGMPALEYTFTHRVEGRPFVAKGVTFMIDGGHMRLSMWYPADDSRGASEFDRFVKSFKLLPIDYRASPSAFTDPRGISFSAPARWVQQPTKNPFQAAPYSNLTRSMVLLFAGNAAYTCRNLQAETQGSGRLIEESQIRLGEKQFTKIVSYEDVPKYSVRLTNVQFCLDTRLGAAVLAGSEEQSMFWRWAAVFEGAAASIRVR